MASDAATSSSLTAPTVVADDSSYDADLDLPRLAGDIDRASLVALAIGLAALVLYAVAPNRDRFAASLATILCFALAPSLFPSVRARLGTPVCPLNWVLLLFLFQLVIDPLLVCYSGPFVNTLPVLPSDAAVNASLFVSVVAWAAFVAGSEIALRWQPTMPSFVRAQLSRFRPEVAPNRIAVVFALIGVAGMGLAFHSPGALYDYFHKAGGHVGAKNNLANSGLAQSASVLLRPFLAFALIVPWCGWVDRRRADQRLVWRTLGIMVLVLLASATYSYNRAAAVTPLLAMIAVYGLRVLRLRFGAICVVVVLSLGLLTAARAYRNTNFTISQVITSPHALRAVLAKVNLNHEIQIYTSAPQFLGYLLEYTGWGSDPHYGRTLVSSVMFPVPHLGAPFRATSGPVIYNHLIYGEQSKDTDQIAPFQGELFLDFTFPGIVAGYLCLALGLRQVQRWFERSANALSRIVAVRSNLDGFPRDRQPRRLQSDRPLLLLAHPGVRRSRASPRHPTRRPGLGCEAMSYGDHILASGERRGVSDFEMMLGRFLYERHFQGKAPVLDLASGRCWFARQNTRDIQAVDIAPELVEHFAAEGIQITEGSAYAIPHEDETFEAVFCCWLFEHLQTPDLAMREIHRVLRPGGMCFLVVPGEHQLSHGFFDDYTHVRPYTPNSLTQLARSNGFGAPVIAHLPYTRFWGRLIPALGHERALTWLGRSDRWLRPLRIVNRNMLTLMCYR